MSNTGILGSLISSDKEARLILREKALEVASDSSEGEIHQNIKEGAAAHVLFTFASFLVIFSFLFFWWTGANLEVAEWSSSDKFAAFVAFIIASSIAIGQYVAYKQGISLKIIIIAKIGLVILCVLADIGMNLDREDTRVNRLSAESPVLQSMLKSAETPIAVPGSSASSPELRSALKAKQDASHWVNGKCQYTHGKAGAERVSRCIEFERGKMIAANDTIQEMSTFSAQSAAAATAAALESRNALYEQAKAKEKDPDNHHALVRFAMLVFSMAPITASVIVSMILMLPLEFLFIANGKMLTVNKMALNIKHRGTSAEPQTANDYDFGGLQADPQTARNEAEVEPQAAKKNWDLAPLHEVAGIAGIEILKLMVDGEIKYFTKSAVTKHLHDLHFGKSNQERAELWEFLKDYYAQEKYITKNYPEWTDPLPGEKHKNGRTPEWKVDLAVCKTKGQNVSKKDLRADLQTASITPLTA